jgi:tRNA nucleotidyltransferase (CCA-adding enzyme)
MSLKPITFYEVGGSIRNELLGMPSKDKDFACECESFEAMEENIAALGKIYLSKPEYLTIRANIPNMGSCDYVLCRKESGYSDKRHPDKVEPGTILEDLSRRDCTMNAIAKNVITGEIIDPYNGRTDIKFKQIRCVGNAKERLQEDTLRAWRILRFAIVLDFQITDDTIKAIQSLRLEDFTNISAERICEEIKKMFMHDTYKSFYLLAQFPFLFQAMVNKNIRFKPIFENN